MRFVQNRSGTQNRPFRTIGKSPAYAHICSFFNNFQSRIHGKTWTPPPVSGFDDENARNRR
jgi:hypothetical protein